MLYKRGMSLVCNILMAAVLVAGVCCNVAAGTADWKPYAADRHFSYYYDAHSVVYPYKGIHNVLNLELADVGIVRVRTKSIIKDEKSREWKMQELKKSGLATKGYDRYDHTVSGLEVNCTGKKYRLLSAADYSREGDQLGSVPKESGSVDWERIPPGSETEALQLAVCSVSEKKRPAAPAVQGEDR